MSTHKSLISFIHWCRCYSSDFVWPGPSGYLVTSSVWRALRGGAFSEGYSPLPVELSHPQTSTHQWLTSVGGLRKCPLQSWPVQALPTQILSRSPSAQGLLHSSSPNQWLFVLQITDARPRGRLAIFGLDWSQSSVLPALPPSRSGLGALLRAPFCHYVMSCPGCSPWSAVIWPLGGLPPPSGECPLVQAQGPTSHFPPRASTLLSPECFGRLKGQLKCSKK